MASHLLIFCAVAAGRARGYGQKTGRRVDQFGDDNASQCLCLQRSHCLPVSRFYSSAGQSDLPRPSKKKVSRRFVRGESPETRGCLWKLGWGGRPARRSPATADKPSSGASATFRSISRPDGGPKASRSGFVYNTTRQLDLQADWLAVSRLTISPTGDRSGFHWGSFRVSLGIVPDEPVITCLFFFALGFYRQPHGLFGRDTALERLPSRAPSSTNPPPGQAIPQRTMSQSGCHTV
jgi:hypothetical protein